MWPQVGFAPGAIWNVLQERNLKDDDARYWWLFRACCVLYMHVLVFAGTVVLTPLHLLFARLWSPWWT